MLCTDTAIATCFIIKPGARRPVARRAWFLRIASVHKCLYVCVFVCLCVCVCVCVHLRGYEQLEVLCGVI